MWILPKAIYRFNSIPDEIPVNFYDDIEKMPKFIRKLKGTAIINWSFKKKEQLEVSKNILQRYCNKTV